MLSPGLAVSTIHSRILWTKSVSAQWSERERLHHPSVPEDPRSCKSALVDELLCGRTAPPGLERRVVALPNVGDKLCAATRVATLETPTECFSFPRHRRRIIGSLRSERTWWSLDRTIVLLPSRSSFLLVCPRLSC